MDSGQCATPSEGDADAHRCRPFGGLALIQSPVVTDSSFVSFLDPVAPLTGT
jgi:hypothetical protein